MWLCITPERAPKTMMMMTALVRGWPGSTVIKGMPPDDHEPFAVWGQEWLTLRVVPKAVRFGRPFFHLDNGYWQPARGTAYGYYRICYRGLSPVLLGNADAERGEKMHGRMWPWRKNGEHVLLAIPGRHFGMALGINVDAWIATAENEIRKHTDRPIKVRARDARHPLMRDLEDCWALVTHSSNVATDAVWHGVPAFVVDTNPAAPVGNLDLAGLERPAMPDREHWWASLMCQQYTLEEMADGTAYEFLRRVVDQVDGVPR